jgi:hypothetical protein
VAIAEFVATATEAVATLEADEVAATEARATARAALVVPEPVVVDGPADNDTGENDSGDEEQIESDKVLEPVTAAATTTPKVPAMRRAAAAAPPVKVEETPAPLATITAAADVPGLSMGSAVATLHDLSEPALDVLTVLGRATGATRIEKPIATINLPRTDGFAASDDRELQRMLSEVIDEARLPGGSLVAAGGWCAPSETLYGLCDGETTDGLWDIPSVNVPRGGLNYTKGPQFSDFYGQSSNFILQTEAQAISGTTKPCISITCPPFVETRLDVTGLCVTVPILTQAAYPEVVARWISGLTVAHQHFVSLNLINRALTIAGSAVAVTNPWPTLSGTLLASLELVVLGERQRYRLGLNQTLEAVFPFWIKAALRADLSIRTGVDLINVTDAQIDAWFAARGVRAQYVYGWQQLTLGGTGTPNGPNPAVAYPTSLEVLLYPAGTFVQGTKDVITLTGVYDSVGLSTNVYTGLFTEEGISLMNMCWAPKRISLPIDISGMTAAAIINQDFGGTPPKIIAASIPVL